jgi:hypothetical protein
LELVEHDLVVRHQRERRLIDDRHVGQLLVRVPGGEHGHGRFVQRREAHARVEIAGGEGCGGHAAQAAAAALGADEGLRAAMVLGRHGPSEIDRPAGDVRVHVDPAGKNDHPRRVDRPPALERLAKAAAVVDIEVLHLAIDAKGRVVDLSARDAKHDRLVLPRGA